MSDMIEVAIDSVRVGLMSPQRVVVLRQLDAPRFIPIWVGPFEAEAITVALQEIEMVRPLTHDLLKNVFGMLNARIKRVEIVALREEIFFGNIVAEVNGEEMNIDARPSDAIALAVRVHAPIYVHKSVMEEAGIVPETDMQSASNVPSDSATGETHPPTEENTDRLSIFEDFLEKLDREKSDDQDKDDSDSDSPKSDSTP
ncbi:MAG: bifunctional nuclease family protein [Anaerolineales bacterium]